MRILIMPRGKQTCKILKEIRLQIAKANDIELVTSECRYKGNCLGTCPKCEAEVRYLEQQLHARRRAGKAVTLAGISMGVLSMVAPLPLSAQVQSDLPELIDDSLVVSKPLERVIVKGRSFAFDDDTERTYSPLIGGVVHNLNTAKSVLTDINGNFEIEACQGDSIEFSYIGYDSQTIAITDTSFPVRVILTSASDLLMGEIPVVRVDRKRKNTLDLYIVDENKKPIELRDVNVRVKRVFLDADGEEDYELLTPSIVENEYRLRLCWDDDWDLKDENGDPLKEATLRIEADGYENAVTIRVKRPKRKAKRIIQFGHKKD